MKDFIVLTLLVSTAVPTAVLGCGGDNCSEGQQQCRGYAIYRCYETGTTSLLDTGREWRYSHSCSDGRWCQASGSICSLTEDKYDPCLETYKPCEGNRALSCNSGYLIDRLDCSPGFCVAPSGHSGACAESDQPDSLCEDYEFSCDGNELLTCMAGYVIGRESCPTFCRRVEDPGAVCTESYDPDPLCGDFEQACDGDELLTCESGYVTERSSCPSACAMGADGGFCAESPEPNPACGDDDVGCEISDILQCRDGFVLERSTCPLFCAAVPEEGVFCTESGEPNPVCDEGSEAVCDDPDIVQCRAGYATARDSCPFACVTGPETGPFCSESTELNPLCEGVEYVCDDRRLISCWEGFVVGGVDCHTCVETLSMCALSDEPNPDCSQFGTFCDGDEAVTCEVGYETTRESCKSCAESDTGIVWCHGGLEAACELDSDCLPGLACSPQGSCSRSCTCDSDTTCFTCIMTDVRQTALTSETRWVCQAGWCEGE